MATTALATVFAGADGDIQSGQFLVFAVATESFALDIRHVKEIIEYGQVTRVPMMPISIRGVINLRGLVVPVIDLRACLHGEPAVIGRLSCIVIVEVEGDSGRQDVGLVVDSVTEVLELPASQIEPPPAFGAHIHADFIQGMGKVNGSFVIVLNVNRILSEQELGLAGMGFQGQGAEACVA